MPWLSSSRSLIGIRAFVACPDAVLADGPLEITALLSRFAGRAAMPGLCVWSARWHSDLTLNVGKFRLSGEEAHDLF